ncbi:MAG: phosphotransferase [Chloroflexota bacterium]|nr:phosphotransferase [Chloroflexota bacterium]
MSSVAATRIPLEPQIEFPIDPGLEELSRAFDGDWIWTRYCEVFGQPAQRPRVIRIRQFSHTPGRGAIVGLVLIWEADAYLPPVEISLRLVRGRSAEISRYPDDHALPGLADAARPDTALGLVNRFVLSIPARRISVDAVRYRPGSRAVLRHTIGKVTLYVRVVRPPSALVLVSASDHIARSAFVAPRLAGHWNSGGAVWFSRIPGRNVRRHIRRGGKTDPHLILDGLESLWEGSDDAPAGRAFSLKRRYVQATRILGHATRGDHDLRDSLHAAIRRLDPFVESWRPSGTAHNDFYDDQMLELPGGRIALVDFEEVGPGDPMLDVGNFLAHLRIQTRLGSDRVSAATDRYHAAFRAASLDRLPWDEGELDLREAVCLFRICTSTIRHISPNWRGRLAEGLSLVNEVLA